MKIEEVFDLSRALTKGVRKVTGQERGRYFVGQGRAVRASQFRNMLAEADRGFLPMAED